MLRLTLTLFFGLASAAAQSRHCDAAFFWRQDGSRIPGNTEWSSFSETSSFAKGPCLGLSGIGTSQTYTKSVLIIDRSSALNGFIRLTGRPGQPAFAMELDVSTGRQRPLDVITNTFCSSGQHMPDGTFLSVGGDWAPDYANGRYTLRAFRPCTGGTCGFTVVANMSHPRWYPTTALLGDGRVIIVGGSTEGVGLNLPATNVPYVEYYPRRGDESYRVRFLEDTLPYNLYPFVHLLPSGRVFLFAGNQWTLFDTRANAAVPGNYPSIEAEDANGNSLRFSYPTSATSVLFPLTPSNNYAAEIMICGGSSTGAIQHGAGDDGVLEVVTNANYPASARCFRIVPESPTPEWVLETPMRLPRIDSTAVLLPDGHVLIVGGSGTGWSALGQVSHNASLTPDMYNTQTHSWYDGPPLPASKIPRAYHFSAVLLHDGRVFISGSNPNSNERQMVMGPQDFPTEFRSEFFLAPYLQAHLARPSILQAPRRARHGATMQITFRYAGRGRGQHLAPETKVVLVHPGFSTHGANHGMRSVELNLLRNRRRGSTYAVSVRVPRNRNVMPPTWYWVFVVVHGVPNTEGVHFFVL